MLASDGNTWSPIPAGKRTGPSYDGQHWVMRPGADGTPAIDVLLDRSATTASSAGAFERDGADDVLEPPHGRQVLGRAPRDEPGPVLARNIF